MEVVLRTQLLGDILSLDQHCGVQWSGGFWPKLKGHDACCVAIPILSNHISVLVLEAHSWYWVCPCFALSSFAQTQVITPKIMSLSAF